MFPEKMKTAPTDELSVSLAAPTNSRPVDDSIEEPKVDRKGPVCPVGSVRVLINEPVLASKK